MARKKCIAMLLAGGQGSRLSPLTTSNAKPAVQFGSRYRIIDFSLSNCVNSGIDTVGVLTQYQPLELNDYLGMGAPWDLNLRFGGLHVLPPYQAAKGGDWFKGTANAIYQNIRFIKQYDPEYVVILSGDHIYKMDYSKMLDAHIANKADCTIAVINVSLEEASRFGIMNTDENLKITEFEEKPAHPKSTLASMGVYIFTTDKLISYLEADEADPDSSNDFGKNIIPNMLGDGQRLFAYEFQGYWRDVGTLGSFWDANMDAIDETSGLKLNDPEWRIYYRHSYNSPLYAGEKAKIHNSICGDGDMVNGSIEHSVLFNKISIEEGAEVKDSIIMSGATIKAGAKVEYAIVDKGAVIGEGAKVGGPKADGAELSVIAKNVTVADGKEASGIVTEDVE
ncbi:MAG: glucose-1-phosphate adenylyltransferase [Eubacteriales bacterium]|nr:glucose-1-phosphate adenylyltransferase [Eubacteriales bacterium]